MFKRVLHVVLDISPAHTVTSGTVVVVYIIIQVSVQVIVEVFVKETTHTLRDRRGAERSRGIERKGEERRGKSEGGRAKGEERKEKSERRRARKR